MEQATGTSAWSFAAANGYAIISKDVDFQQRALLMGYPPKIVWIRVGNCLTSAVADLLRKHYTALHVFEADPAAAFIALA